MKSATAPELPPPIPSSVSPPPISSAPVAVVHAATAQRPSELDRILSLPERDPYDLEVDPRTGKLPPRTMELIASETRKYARSRLSCACRPRRLQGLGGGRVLVYHQADANRPPPPPLPIETTQEALVADAVGAPDEVRKFSSVVFGLRPGQTVEVPGLGIPSCLRTFNGPQAWFMRELAEVRGAVSRSSVGSGKSIANIMAPLAISGCRTALLFGKPTQRLHYTAEYLKAREHFRVPSFVTDDDDQRGSYIVPDAPVLRFVPYSKISNPKYSTFLDSFDDLDAILADEAHLLANCASARTMRWLRLMVRRPDVVFVPSSGSFLNDSILNAAHLFAHALGLGSPYPILKADREAWAAVLDPSPTPDTTSSTAKALRRAFGDPRIDASGVGALLLDNEDICEGFRRRSDRTFGIITTRGFSAPCSIEIRVREAPPMPEEVRKALAAARGVARIENGRTVQVHEQPDGNELVEAFEIARNIREVSMGYFNRWTFPHGEPEDLILDWFAARKAYNRELRQKQALGEPNLDSPSLCYAAAQRAWQEPRYEGDLPVWPAESWRRWSQIIDKVRPVPRTAWVGDDGKRRDPKVHPGYYIARDAAAWAKENRGVVWVQSVALGRAIASLAGIAYHGGGPQAEARILGKIPAEDGIVETGHRSIVASIDAHGESRNGLQFWYSEELVVEIQSSSKGWEQRGGRLARPGQRADTVVTYIYAHVHELVEAFREAYHDAAWVQATSGNRQLLLAADVDEQLLPR